MDAIEVEVAGDEGVKAKLSLLLISLWEKPGALCEGQLLQEAVSAGIPRSEIQIMLGKSASWVCNRLALITRLNHNVYEMVRNGLLEPRSAQEVARLPAQAQFAFAEIAVREGLPKSAIESLIAGYNDESCPDTVKTQILNDPRAALKRMTDKRRAINVDKPDKDKESMPADIIDEYIRSIRMQVSTLRRVFFNEAVFDTMENRVALKGLEAEVKALLMIVRKLISPGKKEVEQNAG
jgi:hypothetical protein